MSMKQRRSFVQPLLEDLEPRQLLASTPTASFNTTTFYFNDIKTGVSGGTGSSPSQSLVIKNTGAANLTIPAGGITLGGTNASQFSISSKATATIAPGASKSFGLIYTANTVGIQTATLTIKTNDTAHATTTINLRGLGTAGTGGALEPSLQQLFNLFQIPDKDGESTTSDNFTIPPAKPNDEVSLQRLMKAGTGPVTINLLATFVNFKTPAVEFGRYTPGNPSSTTQLFSVPNQNDAQSVHPTVSGTTSFDPGTSEFGLYASFPAFNFRDSYSEDNLNTWETKVANQKKIRFYTLKDSTGKVVPNAYIFAAEDWNVSYDFNDVVGIIRNVKLSTAPPPAPGGGGTGGGGTSTPGSIGNITNLLETNLDGLPANDRLVFNRISNPDLIRPNVTHNISTLQIKNTGSSTMTISSITLDDSVDFKITAGGGSNVTLAPGATRNITVQFVGAGTGSSILKTFGSNLKITSGGKTDSIVLAAIWQDFSEQTPENPGHRYDEPSLTQIVNTTLGYKTDVADPGQTKTNGLLVELGTHGNRTPVGDEVFSNYWQSADTSQPVKVRQLAAWHRQNNFDAQGNPLTAAATISFFYKGSSTSLNKLFQHNINEGQSLLPHISGSTTAPAQASFSPTAGKPFGFKIDNRFSDDSLNTQDFDPKTNKVFPDTGHAFRFYPLIDENGNVVPNTYIMAEDYTGLSYSNYDYQDNIYLVSNIKPASTTSTMALVAAPASTASSSVFSSTSVKDSSGNVLGDGSPTVL